MKRALVILALLTVGLIACSQTGTGWYQERRKVNFKDSTSFAKSANFLVPYRINGTAVTSNAEELNILDGALTTSTELNYLIGVTSPIQTQLNAKQSTLVSGTNLKTVNGESLLGSGNIVIDSTGGSMVYPGAGIPVSTGTAWGTSITNNAVQWDSAYVRSLSWDGRAGRLVAATGRTSLGATAIGSAMFTLANPSAVTFPRFNADNTVSALTAANLKTALSLTASDVSLGNVTNESKATMFTSPTFTGHPTMEGVTSTGATGTGNLVFSASPTFTGTVTGTFSGNLTGTASLVTGFTRNSGTLTLSGGHGLTVTTAGITSVTLPTSGTLVANPMTTAGDLIVGGASGVPSRLAAGITGTEEYSTENYGATGMGDIVLSIGPTLTTVSITDVIRLTPTASPPAGATEGMIYADTDHHIYYYNGTAWVAMDN